MTKPVLITTDLDRTLLFSRRATAQLGGGLPAEPVEASARSPGRGEAAASAAGAELSYAARDCLAELPRHVRLCVATSRSVSRLARLRLPFAMQYAIAANGGVVLIDGVPEPGWEARIKRLLAAAAPADVVRGLLAGSGAPDARGSPGLFGQAAHTGPPAQAWLVRMGDADDMCCMAIVDLAFFDPDEFASIGHRCRELGWEASLVGRKLYAFPTGFGKEHAATYVAERVAAQSGAAPRRLAAGDTEHDRRMMADADLAWVPAGSELASASPNPAFVITREPGHAAAAQITSDWLRHCRDGAVFP